MDYQQTDKFKASQKRYRQSEKGKATRKRYEQSEKGKTRRKDYYKSEIGIASHRKAVQNYQKTDKGKANAKRHRQSEKGRAKKRILQKCFCELNPNQIKATSAVNNAIKADKLPRPDTLQCHYCPEPAKQYHHLHGYAPEHWLDVIPVCVPCHIKCKRKIA